MPFPLSIELGLGALLLTEVHLIHHFLNSIEPQQISEQQQIHILCVSFHPLSWSFNFEDILAGSRNWTWQLSECIFQALTHLQQHEVSLHFVHI